jgi:TatD DNase family protein
MRAPLIDSHAHLEMRQFKGDLERVLERAQSAGLAHIVTVGSTLAESRRALKIAEKYNEVSAVVGIHPHDAADVDEHVMVEIEKLARRKRVVGVGETGLDFFRDRSPRELQEDSFRKHLALAKETDLPVVIHIRDAYSRALEIINEEGIPDKGAVIHCFSGSIEDAETLLGMGLYLSFTGTVTYQGRRNRDWASSVLRVVPMERMMIETDCPYLTPHPNRGGRNEPAYVQLVADKIAELKELTPDDVARITSRNAIDFFNLPVKLSDSNIAYTIRDSVYLNVTGKCTSACTFCHRSTDQVVKGHDLRLRHDPTPDEMMAALEDENWKDRSEVVFCGYGEPTIRLPEITRVVSELRQRDPTVKIRLNTNGLGNMYHSRNIVHELTFGIDTVSVSLNAQDEETFMRLCRPTYGQGSYNSVLDFSKKCVDAGIDTVLTVVSHPDVDIEACRAIAEKMGARFRVRHLNEVG